MYFEISVFEIKNELDVNKQLTGLKTVPSYIYFEISVFEIKNELDVNKQLTGLKTVPSYELG